MREYRRPSLLTADQLEVSSHLLSKGIQARITKDATAMLITIAGTAADLDAAMADFANVGESWRPPLPGDLPAHVQHLRDFLALTPAQLATATPQQMGHAVQDAIRAIKTMLDDRIG